jgi:DoxX-like family
MQAIEIQYIRYSLAAVWLITGIISLGIYPVEDSLSLLAKVGIHGDLAVITLFGEAVLDIAIGVLTITAPSKRLWLAQALIVGAYSLVVAVRLPEYLIHPFGPILKNLPIFTLLWLLYRNQGASQ